MTEFTANGSDVFNWLQTADLDQAKDILIGCGIDNGLCELRCFGICADYPSAIL